MIRFRLHALIVLTTLLLIAGCARTPPPGEPLTPSDLSLLVASLNGHIAEDGGVRGAGMGEIMVGGRRFHYSFALVYSRPGWLRGDFRPEVGMMGASLTALAMIEDDCAWAYFPARMTLIRGCFEDAMGGFRANDPASFLVGLPDASYLLGLADPTILAGDGSATVAGTIDGHTVTTELDTNLDVIRRIEVIDADEKRGMTIAFAGHGWKDGLPVPRSVKLTAFDGTARDVRVELDYRSLRATEDMDRGSYSFDVPEGARILSWRDLFSRED